MFWVARNRFSTNNIFMFSWSIFICCFEHFPAPKNNVVNIIIFKEIKETTLTNYKRLPFGFRHFINFIIVENFYNSIRNCFYRNAFPIAKVLCISSFSIDKVMFKVKIFSCTFSWLVVSTILSYEILNHHSPRYNQFFSSCSIIN